MHKITVLFIALTIMSDSLGSVKFRRKLLAAGFSHYKILLSLGTCKENRMFIENKIWPSIPISRVFDIYYKSQSDEFKVSKVEIFIVLNHSDVLASSDVGIGGSEFSAELYLPSGAYVIFYSLQIFTCSHPVLEHTANPEQLFCDKKLEFGLRDKKNNMTF